MKTKLELIKERQEYIEAYRLSIDVEKNKLIKIFHGAGLVRGKSANTATYWLTNEDANINTLCDICDYIENNKGYTKNYKK